MHILVVDDKQAVRDSLINLLEGNGYKVDSACNGLDAFEKAQKFNYDLFIIDHLMPIMNGLQLTKNLSQQAETMLTPILFMTTQGVESINNAAEAQLFSSILAKPINEENLLSQVIQLNIKNIQLHSL